MTPIWHRKLKHWLRHGRGPDERRLRIWRARAAFEKAASRLGAGDVALDCGANLGVYTRRLARSGATVHAFEPDPFCAAQLRDQFADAPNVVIHEAAVGAADGSAALFRRDGFAEDPAALSQSSTLVASKPGADMSSAIDVAVIGLGAFMETHGPVALLKLDIEGAEAELLDALLKSDGLRSIEAVFVETHDNKIPAIAPLMRSVRDRIAEGGLSHVNLDWA